MEPMTPDRLLALVKDLTARVDQIESDSLQRCQQILTLIEKLADQFDRLMSMVEPKGTLRRGTDKSKLHH